MVDLDFVVNPDFANTLMKVAVQQAEQGAAKQEVPVGAVIWQAGLVLSAQHNLVEAGCDATAHAEVLAIREAGRSCKNWRLDGAVLCVTLEPCPMCWAAILAARIAVVIYGASQPEPYARYGSVRSHQYDSREYDRRVRVIRGVMEERCEETLKQFFRSRR